MDNQTGAAQQTYIYNSDLSTIIELPSPIESSSHVLTIPSIVSLYRKGYIPIFTYRALMEVDAFLGGHSDCQLEEILASDGSLLSYYYLAGKLTLDAKEIILSRLSNIKYALLLEHWLTHHHVKHDSDRLAILSVADDVDTSVEVRCTLYNIFHEHYVINPHSD